MSTLKSKIGAALALPALKKTLKSFDATEYGGAPLLGLNGLVVKTHGSSKAKEVTNSIFQCVTFKEQDINDKIKEIIVTLEEKQKNRKEESIMEFEKLKKIIAEVLNVDEKRLLWILHSLMTLELIHWMYSRLLWVLRKNLILRFQMKKQRKLLL